MLYFEHKSERESEDKFAVVQYFGSEFIPIANAQRGVRSYFSVCLIGSQTKLKITPNRKPAASKDIIMDTYNRHIELM